MSKKKATGATKAGSKATAERSRREVLRAQQAADAARRKRVTIIGAIITAIVALAIIAVIAVVVIQDQNTKREQREREAASQITPPNAVGDKAILVNPDTAGNAKYELNIYLDYQCPACKQAEALYAKVWDQLAAEGFAKIQIHTMTFMDNNIGNDSSKKMAVAAACADVSGKGNYIKYHTKAFELKPEGEAQSGYPDDLITQQIPQQAGITGEAYNKWKSCYDSNATAEFTRKTNENAGKDGVTSTPTIMVGTKNPVAKVDAQGRDTFWWQDLDPDVAAWKKAIEDAHNS